MTLDLRARWEKIYSERKADEVSWYQETPTLSLELIRQSRVPKDGKLIDVGGGASRLVDCLLDEGFAHLSVLDISARALGHAQDRLGERAKKVSWIAADATTHVSAVAYDVWHDRAVFHFLTEEDDRSNYVDRVRESLKPGGTLILSAFAPDGPETCSGLPVRRCDGNLVREAFGREFELLREASETHVTPWKTEQKFRYFVLRRSTNG